MRPPIFRFITLTGLLGLTLLASATHAQQIPDPDFDAKVADPAFKEEHPKILFDEAHHNFHTAGGRYKPFADLMTSDGFEVVPNTEKFSADRLKGCNILVIANARGDDKMGSPEASNAAFAPEECDAVKAWVDSGGCLLFIVDHAPMGSANEELGKRFGVAMGETYTIDKNNSDGTEHPSQLIYSRDNKLLGDHPITRGRNETESIKKIKTFTGQSIKGPPGSSILLKLSDSAQDLDANDRTKMNQAVGDAQGIAFKSGSGRVVVLGEAAFMTAQLSGPNKRKIGMNVPGWDNRQFALNTMHWLSGLLN